MWWPQVTGCADCRCVKPGIGQSAPASACATRARISAAIASSATSPWSRTQSRKSVATWSLRDRAVCRRPAAGPATSRSRASTFMWMSSRSSRKVKLPPLDL